MKKYIKITLGLLLGIGMLTSCEVDPEEVLLAEDYLGDDELDARSALFGVLSQMQEVAPQYLLLGEMRADLVDVNDETVDELRQLSNLEINPDNSFIDPTTLFSIINNCNFALVGIDTEAYDNRLLEDYASIMRIRTWAQMQILINYGKLPYIDKPIRSDDNFEDEYKLLNFNQALTQLIRNLQAIADIENVTKYDNSLGFNVESMIPNNDILLGDLLLWSGDYVGAAVHYKTFIDNTFGGGPIYKLTNNSVNVKESGGTYNVSGSWGSIFNTTLPNTSEVINYIGFSEDYRQSNYINNIAYSQMEPSQSILLNWESQTFAFDGEPVSIEAYTYAGNTYTSDYRRAASVYQLSDENLLISKYRSDYFTWNRATKIYLRYAEAINYAGYPEHALAILNGIFNNPDVEPKDAPIFNNPQTFLNFEPETYFTLNNNDEPTSGMLGIRGRVGLEPLKIVYAELDESEKINPDTDNDGIDDLTEEEVEELEWELIKAKTNSIEQVGNYILNEAALELAFEGNRWEDLVRFSKRANNPDIIANAIADKFELNNNNAKAELVKQYLSNPENWFLPLEVPSNFVTQE